MNLLRVLVLVLLSLPVAGCVAYPVSSSREAPSAVGRHLKDDQVKAMVSDADTAETIRARFGEPLLDLGPRRVFVYGFNTKETDIRWIVAVPPTGFTDVATVAGSRLLFVAFDSDGRVLKVGTAEYSPLRTMSGNVRRWLASDGLTAQVTSPRPDDVARAGSMLVVYRPSLSACPFLLFDFSTIKLKITVDGHPVGDLTKGEYLASEITANDHSIGIESYSNFFLAGHEGEYTSYARENVTAELGQPTYIEAYICTGQGRVDTHTAVRDAETALKRMGNLRPAW